MHTRIVTDAVHAHGQDNFQRAFEIPHFLRHIAAVIVRYRKKELFITGTLNIALECK